MKKESLITLIIVVIVLLLATIVLTRGNPDISEELAKCIGENSELYVRTGCHACEIQEEMFGEDVKYINIIDCFTGQCPEIRATPTWVIKGQRYIGVQSIETLKTLTDC